MWNRSMSVQKRDRRDEGRAGLKEWEEFRSHFSVSFLLVWLLRDLPDLAPDYSEGVKERVMSAKDWVMILSEDDPDYDGALPVSGPDPDAIDIEWWDAESADLLDQIFAHDDTDEFIYSARGLAAVGLHSALELFAEAVGVSKYGRLPNRIGEFLKDTGSGNVLDAELFKRLVEFDEARHLMVHSRGVVTERYIESVPYCRLQTGEVRRIAEHDLHRYSHLVWTSASLLRRAAFESR